MTIHELKVLLIKQIASCENEQQLKQMLAYLSSTNTPGTSFETDQMMAALLQEGNEQPSESAIVQQDIDDIQASINELFGR